MGVAQQPFLERLMLLDADEDDEYLYHVSRSIWIEQVFTTKMMWIALSYHLHTEILKTIKACSTS